MLAFDAIRFDEFVKYKFGVIVQPLRHKATKVIISFY
jgi:hypothetical protein